MAGVKAFLLYLWTTKYLLKFALIVGMAGLTCGYDSGQSYEVFFMKVRLVYMHITLFWLIYIHVTNVILFFMFCKRSFASGVYNC